MSWIGCVGNHHPCCRNGGAVSGGTTLCEEVPRADRTGHYTHFFRADQSIREEV